MWPPFLPPLNVANTPYFPACGCILTLKLTGQPEEHEKRSWTVPAEYRNRNDAKVAVVQLAFEQGAIEFLRFSGEPPPEGYKVELPPPRESRKAKRKATEATENEDGNPKKKPKLLSQTRQFLAAAGPPKPAVVPAVASRSFNAPQTQPTSAVPIFLPRPGYVDSKPEPGELPDEPPVVVAPRRPAPVPFQRTRELLPPRRPATEPSLHHTRSEPRGAYDYGVREHGHQYELGVGGTRYDDPGVYAPDPYNAPPPAPHTEPWHARASAPARSYPAEDDEYRRTYHGNDHAPPPPGYDYDYGRHNRYTPPPAPLVPPEPAHGYDDLARRSGYDDGDGDGYAYGEYAYAHTPPALRRPQQRTPPPLLSPPPPSPPPPDLTAPGTGAVPRRWAPPPSPPRVWQPGPRAARMDAPPMSAVVFSRGGAAEATMSAPPAASSSSSSSSTPGSSSAHHLHSKAPTPVSEPTVKPKTCKEELIGMSRIPAPFPCALSLSRCDKALNFPYFPHAP